MFTPYYSETVLYSKAELQEKNEDGISLLFYLQKIYPGTPCLCLVFPALFDCSDIHNETYKYKFLVLLLLLKYKVLVLVLFKEK